MLVSALEHNSVMRPLRHLEATLEVTVEVVKCGPDGTIDPACLARALKEPARLVAVNHASNVTGALAPIERVSDIAHAAGASLLVDAAQTAGAYPIDVAAMGIDYLAFTGHKSLFGPQGTGGLVIECRAAAPADVRWNRQQLREGTASPSSTPTGWRAGRSTASGFAGLAAGLEYIDEQSVEAIGRRARARLGRLLEGLASTNGVRVHGPADPERQIGVVSITFDGSLAGRGRLTAGRRLRGTDPRRAPLLAGSPPHASARSPRAPSA